jgi:hypothetical protein
MVPSGSAQSIVPMERNVPVGGSKLMSALSEVMR